MAIATHTTLSQAYKTPVSTAFSSLLECLSELTALGHAEPNMGCFHGDEHITAELATARSTVLTAAQAVLDKAIEHPLDGVLTRLATLCELQMILECPEERAGLYAMVMDNFDIFTISGFGASHAHVRELQRLFFMNYADLVEGPIHYFGKAQTDLPPQFSMIPA